MQLRNINHTYYIKDEDTATKIKLQVLDYENQPFDLKSAEKVEVVIGINEGRLLTKEPDLLDETGVLEFRIDEDDVLVVGKNLVEVHITTIDGRLQKAPSKGYYELIASRSIDTLGANVTKITLQRLLDEIEETKQDLTDEVENAIGYVDAKISQMQSDVQDAVQYTSETVNQVRQEFNEQLDTTVSNKMTPFVEVVNERLAENKLQIDEIKKLENFELRSNKRRLEPLIVFTIDDGGIHDYQTVLPILSARGFVASSGIITSEVGINPYTMNWEQIKELHSSGWEIVSHAVTNVDLTTLTDTKIHEELHDSKVALQSQGFDVQNFFLPQGKYNDVVKQIARIYYRSVRVSGSASTGKRVNYSPFDMYHVDSIFFGDTSGVGNPIDNVSGYVIDTVDYMKYYIDLAVSKNAVLCIGLHSNILYSNNRQNDFETICDYIKSKNIEVVTYNEMLNRVGNIIDTPDLKIGAEGKIGGNYGKVYTAPYNSVLSVDGIDNVEEGFITTSTVTNAQGSGYPNDTGGTQLAVKLDNLKQRAFQFYKPYGKDMGIFFRDFDDNSPSDWQRMTPIYEHKTPLPATHTLSDLKAGRINFCTILSANAVGYPKGRAGLLIVPFYTGNHGMVFELYKLYNSQEIYIRHFDFDSKKFGDWIPLTPLSGTTAQRPNGILSGFNYFDTTINKPIWWNGTNWVDAMGTIV